MSRNRHHVGNINNPFANSPVLQMTKERVKQVQDNQDRALRKMIADLTPERKALLNRWRNNLIFAIGKERVFYKHSVEYMDNLEIGLNQIEQELGNK